MTIDDKFLRLRMIARNHGKYVMNKLFYDYVSSSTRKKIVPSCILCGVEENLTKEHILPKWVFESNAKHFFITDVNQLPRAYISATLPACKNCNIDLLNSIELAIKNKVTVQVDSQDYTLHLDQMESIINFIGNDSEIRVIHWIAKTMKADYLILLNGKAKEKIGKELNLSSATITRAIASLKENQVITKDPELSVTTFRVNPDIIVKLKFK